MAKKRKFPEVIWVRWSEEDGWEGGPVLLAEQDIKGVAQKDGRIVVGCYRLDGTAAIVNETKVESDRKRK